MKEDLIRRKDAIKAIWDSDIFMSDNDIIFEVQSNVGRNIRNIPSANVIQITQEDFGTLCICALRYCHGRRTYMPDLVQSIVRTHFEDLSDKDLKVIADDERFQSQMNLWGDPCDMTEWMKFYRALEEFRGEQK